MGRRISSNLLIGMGGLFWSSGCPACLTVRVHSTITGDDIEDILKRSEQKTAELDSKYANMGLDDLQKFSLAGGGSVYEWEGADFRVYIWLLLWLLLDVAHEIYLVN